MSTIPPHWRQKAPSAKRCIKTIVPRGSRGSGSVPSESAERQKGALRHVDGSCLSFSMVLSQKAPSAKRCIKTCSSRSTDFGRVGQKAPSGKNFARNSLLSTLHQLLEIAEFQRFDFKRRNNRMGITCNIFAEPSVARTKRRIKTVSALNTRGYRCSLG